MKIRYFFICLVIVVLGVIYVNSKIQERWLTCKINNYTALKEMLEKDDTNEKQVHNEENNLMLKSKSACVYDCNSKRVLYSKNSDERLPMASTTKIMTCIVALENANLEDICTISSYAASMPDVQLNAIKGEKFKIRDLLYSLMLESHNDVAVAIAEHIGKSFYNKYEKEDAINGLNNGIRNDKKNDNDYSMKNSETNISKKNNDDEYNRIDNVENSKKYVAYFAKLMNKKVKELGLKNTNFVTPNGLDAEKHYTTAVELAKIAAYAIENKEFIKITNTPCYTFKSDKGRVYTVNNKNQFLNNYSGAIGCKTGYTSKAGYCFVGAINQCCENVDKCSNGQKNQYKLVSVVLGCGWPPHKTYKWQDTKKLMDYVVNNFSTKEVVVDSTILNGKKISIENGLDYSELQPYINERFSILLNDNDNISVKSKLIKKIVAPVKKGQIIGYVDVMINGKEYKRIYIRCVKNIKKLTYAKKFTELLHFFTSSLIDINLNNVKMKKVLNF